MTSALSIFFKNFECSYNEDDDEDQHHEEEEGTSAVANSNHTNEDEENDEEDNKSLSEISAASTTKSLPISAFHIQIVSDNAISSVTTGVHHDDFSSDPTCTSSIYATTTPLLPQRRHSTPVPLLHSQGRRIPRPVHPQSTSESLLSRRWKKWHDQRHHGCDAFPDIVARRRATKKSSASSLLPYSASPVSSNSSSSCSLLVSSSSSRWHSGDQLVVPRNNKNNNMPSPLMIDQSLIQPIRRSCSRDDIVVQKQEDPCLSVVVQTTDTLGKNHMYLRRHRGQNQDKPLGLLSSSILSHSGGIIRNSDVC